MERLFGCWINGVEVLLLLPLNVPLGIVVYWYAASVNITKHVVIVLTEFPYGQQPLIVNTGPDRVF